MLRTIVLLLLSQHHEFLPTQSPSQVHYSFHYAQQVHFPSDPLQPDPIYFPSDPLQADPIYFPSDPFQHDPIYFPSDPIQPDPIYFLSDPLQPDPIYFPSDPLQPDPIYFPSDPFQPDPIYFPSDPLQPDPIYFPSDPLQPDPIYFLTTRKCSVFGVCYEAIPRQIDFITDESGETGKGANAVISRLRCFYENHGLGEKDVIFMLTTVLARTRTI